MEYIFKNDPPAKGTRVDVAAISDDFYQVKIWSNGYLIASIKAKSREVADRFAETLERKFCNSNAPETREA